MMRETGRRLLGIGARARFAAYSLFEKKSSGDSNFVPGAEKYILKSPDGALEVTVSGGKLTYSAAVGGITVIKPSEIGLLVQGSKNIGADVTLGEPKIEPCEETYRDLDAETDITDRHMNYIIPVRAKKKKLYTRSRCAYGMTDSDSVCCSAKIRGFLSATS